MVGLTQSTFAVAVVAVLMALFVLLLLGSLVRARHTTTHFGRVGELAGHRPGAVTIGPAAKARVVVSRRDFFRGGLLASLGVFAAQFGLATIAFLWPNLKSGFGSVITVPDPADTILGQIHSERQPYYFGAGRFYLIDYQGDGLNGIYAGITSAVGGANLMAIYQKCAHLGCRVPFCQQSQWFECPCHGSKYNSAGEYELGPAPTGLHRFAVTLDKSTVKVDTSNIITGPPRGTDTIRQSPEGPFCV